MSQQEQRPVELGQRWRDRDKRMLSGNRVVLVIGVDADYVNYCDVPQRRAPYRSKRERFVKAFSLVSEVTDAR